jgi:arylsulfatase
MNQYWIEATRVAAALTVGLLVVAQGALAQTARPKIVHDSEDYILEAQHGQKWAAEDKALDAKLAELRSKFGAPPNIIHIMFDDTPVGDIGIRFIQKQRGWETPNMNRLADEGINFARLYTEPSCTPSRAALMTGRYAVRTGNGSMPIDTPRYGVVQWEQTMAEVLSDAGYATGMFGKWHLGRTEGRYPTDQGFDEWFGIPNSSDEAFWPDSSMYRTESDPMAGPEYLMESTKGQAPRKLKIYDLAQRRIVDRELTGKAKDFIARQVKAGRPFFAFVPYAMPHHPITPAPEFDGKSGNGYWADALAQMDAYTGELLDTVDKLGIRNDTIFIFTSDNGPEMTEPWNGWGGRGVRPTLPPLRARFASPLSSAGLVRFRPGV